MSLRPVKNNQFLHEYEVNYQLSYQDVIEILDIIDRYTFEDFRLEIGSIKLNVQKGKANNSIDMGTQGPNQRKEEIVAEPAHEENAGHAQVAAAAMLEETAENDSIEVEDGVPIKTSIMGVFYEAPSPGAEPFVRLGSRVKKGDQIGIVEVMKVMNSIKSSVEGVVKEILVENEDMVEAGQTLMIVEEV